MSCVHLGHKYNCYVTLWHHHRTPPPIEYLNILSLSLSLGWSATVQVPQLSPGATVQYESCSNDNPAASLLHVCLSPPLFFFFLLTSHLLFREGHHSRTALLLEPDLHELQLDLLSRFAPQQLLGFLQTSQHYRLEEAVQVRSTIYWLCSWHELCVQELHWVVAWAAASV